MARLTKRTLHGWELAAPCAPGVPLAALARYENMHNCYHSGLGGNGDADLVVAAVDELPLKK